jgi:hypothetical protein
MCPYKDPEYKKKWQKEHPESQQKWRDNHQEQYRKSIKEYGKKYRLEHPEITKAEDLAKYHIPLKSCCEFGSCGSTEHLQRAHMDYDYPLEVLTFCCKHHHLIDKLYRRFD